MKVVILAGGLGTRLSEYTHSIPKPMIPIGDNPMLWHIMQTYSYYGHKDFYLAAGYKGDVIKNYFLNYYYLESDFTINLATGKTKTHSHYAPDWNVTTIDTGLNTMTGGRLKKLKKYIGNEQILLTYGDGLSDINIDELISFHNSHGKMVTITAVHPVARFGELAIDKSNRVQNFKEKPQTNSDWINGGYFVINPEFFEYLSDESTCVLEKEPLEEVARIGELMAYTHSGFWHCVDSKRDKDYLEKLWNEESALWKK